MKRVFIILTICTFFQVISYGQLTTPQQSPTQTIKQNFGLGSIELSYSRPGMKGRKIFGDLVPFGKVWRTGANQATTISFADDVTIGGKKITAGKYGLLSIPAKDNWTLIITPQLNVTSPDAYKQDSDIVRVVTKPMVLKDKIENFTMQFGNLKGSSCELNIMWDNTAVTLPISTDVDTKVMAQINQAMTSEKPPFFQAASYYFDNDRDLAKAKEWAQKAITADPKAFYVVHLLAKIQAKTGDKAGAIATAKKSIELAKEAKNPDYVALNEKLIASLN
ncbi:MAG: DUF2911 domain-containing protein [Chitinophagaceae bacterium]